MKDLIVVESDGHLILDLSKKGSKDIQKTIQRFAEHIKTIGHLDYYYISSLSIWNALSIGVKKDKIIELLNEYTTFPIPLTIQYYLQVWLDRFDKLTLRRIDKDSCQLVGDEATIQSLSIDNTINEWLIAKSNTTITFSMSQRGVLKQYLVRNQYNVIDKCGYEDGEGLSFELLKHQKFTNQTFELREYQRKAIASFHRDRIGGSGVIVLPCGTGKTLTGIGVMASLQCETIIITSNTISCEQWKDELLSKTTLTEDDIGIYGGKKREVRAITITTYHILSYRQTHTLHSPHIDLFNQRNWGLVIYDEVHLLPAPIFRMTANIQATRRLGLTATLIREDGCAPDVFALVGAKLFDFQWKEAEERKVIARAQCYQVHVPFSEQQFQYYKKLNKREQYKYASTNINKIAVIEQILNMHSSKQVLIIGHYIEQLTEISTIINVPLITGQTPHEQRYQTFQLFREGQLNVIVLSKIANLALNLPNASVAIQVSGSYGSRQEEAQRVGRILRPKAEHNCAFFYSLVSKHTIEEQFAINRGKFLEDQGYTYEVIEHDEINVLERIASEDAY